MTGAKISMQTALSQTARRVAPGGTFGGVSLDVVIAEGKGGEHQIASIDHVYAASQGLSTRRKMTMDSRIAPRLPCGT